MNIQGTHKTLYEHMPVDDTKKMKQQGQEFGNMIMVPVGETVRGNE